jgi:hypothetical protein
MLNPVMETREWSPLVSHPMLKLSSTTQDSRELEKTRLSEDWRLSEPHLSFAIQCGLSVDAVHREALKFKNYYIGRGILMVDWDRAWQNWCIRAVEYADARRSTNAQSRRSLVAGLLPRDSSSQWGQS